MITGRGIVRSGVVLALALAAALAMPPVAQQPGQAASTALEIPAEAKARPNPVPADEASVENGRLLFASQCAMCHGIAGKGDGPLAMRLKLVLPDFSTEKQQNSRTDGELFWVLTNGHGRMPGDGERLPEKSRWDLVNYLHTLLSSE